MSLKCPYCEAVLADPEDCYSQDETYKESCPECEKNFVFTISYSVDYESYQADCLNGKEHDWKPIIGSPKEYFEHRRRCSMCDKVIVVKEK